MKDLQPEAAIGGFKNAGERQYVGAPRHFKTNFNNNNIAYGVLTLRVCMCVDLVGHLSPSRLKQKLSLHISGTPPIGISPQHLKCGIPDSGEYGQGQGCRKDPP